MFRLFVTTCAFLFFAAPIFSKSINVTELEILQLETGSSKINSSKKCGEIHVLYESIAPLKENTEHLQYYSYAGRQFLKSKRKLPKLKRVAFDEFSYQTPEAKVFINNPEALHWKFRQTKEYLANILADRLQKLALVKYRAEVASFESNGVDIFSPQLDKMQDQLFRRNHKHPGHHIRLLMTLYPDLRSDIIDSEHNELRPLLCHYEHQKHNRKILLRWSNVMIISAVTLGVTTIVVSSQGIAIPALVITAGAAAAAVGFKDIGLGIYNWRHKEKAAKFAERFKLILKEMKKTIKHLEKKNQADSLSQDEKQLLTKLKDINDAFPKERRKQLNKVARSKHFNRILIAIGVLNAGFNGINLSGDATLLAKLPKMLLGWLHII